MRNDVRWPGVLSGSALALVLAVGAPPAAEAASLELISRADPIADSDGSTLSFSLSVNGRYIAFVSLAPNLAPGQVDGNLFYDTFLRDRILGTTTLLSHVAGLPNVASSFGDFVNSLGPPTTDVSADGRYIVFSTAGIDLVPGVVDKNHDFDVYLYDRVTETNTLISHVSGDPQATADGNSLRARISADGNYVVFTSTAKNLVAGQIEPPPSSSTSSTEDVFLYHRPSGTLTLISRKSGSIATTGNGTSAVNGISADGNFIVFTSVANDLIPGLVDTNEIDVYLYQRSSGTSSLVNHASGLPLRTSNAGATQARLSSDGRWITFTSSATNLIPGQIDTPNSSDIFLYDRVSGEKRLVSRMPGSPVMAAGGSGSAVLSADGRYVGFLSTATKLVPGQRDTNGISDVFIYDRVAGTTALVTHIHGSQTTAAAASRTDLIDINLSADGRFMTFRSFAADLVPRQTDTGTTADVFLYDRALKSTVLVSHTGDSLTTVANGFSSFPQLSQDGSVIIFSSTATNLGDGQTDTFGYADLFLYNRGSAEVTALSQRDPNLPFLSSLGSSSVGDISADGRFVIFLSKGINLVPGQIDEPVIEDLEGFVPTWDVFLRDRLTGKTTLLSRTKSSPPTAARGLAPAVISSDGKFAVFGEPDKTPSDAQQQFPLYIYDRIADKSTLINHQPGSTLLAEGRPFARNISADGRYVAFSCSKCKLVPGQQDRDTDTDIFHIPSDVFLYDRTTGTNILVSHAVGSPVTTGEDASSQGGISADGRFVVYSSSATNLFTGQASGANTGNIFVFDRSTGLNTLVSHTAASATTPSGHSFSSSISADGRWIFFESTATDLVPGAADTNGKLDLFLYDRLSGAITLISHTGDSLLTAANGDSFFVDFPNSVSADGRWFVFASQARDLVPGGTDTNGFTDIFLYDRLTNTVELVSHTSDSLTTTSNGSVGRARISADGSRIGYLSNGTNLVPGQTGTNKIVNLIVYNRNTRTATLVGRVHTTDPVRRDDNLSFAPRMSTDGRQVIFTSSASDLVLGDFNGDWDVYLYDDTRSPGGSNPLPPCILLDTHRVADGPALHSNVRKVVGVRGACGVPATAKRVSVKITVLQGTAKGNLQFFPGNVTAPASGILRFERQQTRTGSFNLPLATNGAGTIALLPFVTGNGTVHVVVEVNGYFE